MLKEKPVMTFASGSNAACYAYGARWLCLEVLIQGKRPCHLSTGKQLWAFQMVLVVKYLLPMQET